ncbi:hypothetical protein BJV85_000510 [Clostridium acetobutylicum]|uniref:Uncharacterized protein n=1 Tax=Clostridium acetobutylicum (strain ATCC 824 / DSM 792 / JCM 1419 / IAM 19013 / LMG 5710 / NBRC 13948 / NRRL B-527 / VKM B-1787 / 2291 / W) TaxID=272562 RepID=Q97DS9_CLOAB|nr:MULTISPECIES: hypothetical protein [Clostridium]AAK81323.1 Hypothetical protein CA_C3393 [Clostridium acetobutylicum ATCC 824]ADZ22433.1 Conserved hypothetical protein [Clostridium acetobutylicum EA 2018]AEI32817.1 hypothetical protein SMB_G3430 [Clostridium acetobutylicum DSM 1731]AWV81010.1 hypothetical protein DK921_13040 [Clostridium acetobutylicum]MBC2395523.1 hypothetical protein [Clostridium acetobutylicum]
MDEDEIIKAFDMMWGKYIEPVALIRHNFNVVALNDAAKSLGMLTGVKCSAKNPESHKGCKAAEALRTNSTQISKDDISGSEWTSFWIPVSGHPDYYVHFASGINEYLKNSK